MERLTKRAVSVQGVEKVCCTHFGENDCEEFQGDCVNGCPWEEKVWERLCAYEDTGLEPEQVDALKLSIMGKAITEIKEFDGVPVDRLRELAQADKEDRVFALPVPLGTPLYQIVKGRSSKDTRYLVVRKTIASWGNIRVIKVAFGKTFFLTREDAEEVPKERAEHGEEGHG